MKTTSFHFSIPPRREHPVRIVYLAISCIITRHCPLSFAIIIPIPRGSNVVVVQVCRTARQLVAAMWCPERIRSPLRACCPTGSALKSRPRRCFALLWPAELCRPLAATAARVNLAHSLNPIFQNPCSNNPILNTGQSNVKDNKRLHKTKKVYSLIQKDLPHSFYPILENPCRNNPILNKGKSNWKEKRSYKNECSQPDPNKLCV